MRVNEKKIIVRMHLSYYPSFSFTNNMHPNCTLSA